MSTGRSPIRSRAAVERQFALYSRLAAPWRWWTRAAFFGMERVPAERPLLFVGNHTLYGVLDAPLFVVELYRRHGIVTRSLGDHLHFMVPGWRDFLERFGVVEGTRPNCARLMQSGECVLVFPGGGREVAKRKGERYRLIWKERLGFARMAIQHGCTIVPFAAVGVEDSYDILFDADDLMRTPLGAIVERAGIRSDVIWPLSRGVGPTGVPRPHRYYFHVGEPIATEGYGGRWEDDEAARDLRDQVRGAVESGIAHLRMIQAADPDRIRFPRVFSKRPSEVS